MAGMRAKTANCRPMAQALAEHLTTGNSDQNQILHDARVTTYQSVPNAKKNSGPGNARGRCQSSVEAMLLLNKLENVVAGRGEEANIGNQDGNIGAG